MRLRKVAFDVNIPGRIVPMFNSAFRDQGFEFFWEPQIAAPNAPDEHWAMAFRRFGGEIIFTGDKNIAKRPHQIMAFKENELICFFFSQKWQQQELSFQCAHLFLWWTRIQPKLNSMKPRDCFWIPMSLRAGDLKAVALPAAAQQAGIDAIVASKSLKT